MGQQAGPLRLTGTHSDFTFYEMHGESFWRKKSSLTKERVKTDPAFAKSRRAAALLGAGAKLAGKVYRALPMEKKKRNVIGRLSGLAAALLREGAAEEDILRSLNAAME